jgi:hypothetical protein
MRIRIRGGDKNATPMDKASGSPAVMIHTPTVNSSKRRIGHGYGKSERESRNHSPEAILGIDPDGAGDGAVD